MNNVFADDITFAGKMAKYNAHCKRILSNRQVLARILKEIAEEFKDMSYKDIMACIEGTPFISQLPVVGEYDIDERIMGIDTVDSVPNEGTIAYDIRFVVYLPKSNETVKMIINVEGQNRFQQKYPLVTRGIFYGARMISSQYGVEFKNSEYQNIKKVYSIWICMNVPNYIGNAVSIYSMNKRDILGRLPDERNAYDKLVIGIVCINKKIGRNNNLTDFLNIIFSKELKSTEKLKRLRKEHNMVVERDMEEEMKEMCNIAEGLVDEALEEGIIKGYQRGIEQGMEKGMQEGMEKGMQEGIEKGIKKSIAIMRKTGLDDNTIIKLIADEYDKSEDEVSKYV